MVRIRRIGTVEGVTALEKEWDALLEECPYRELYLRHDWVDHWCRHFAKRIDLHVLLIEDDGRLIGVAPLMITKKRVGSLTVRKLGFLINGCSVRSNLIVPPRHAKKALGALAHYLRETESGWDLAVLHGISERSALLEGLYRAFEEEKGFIVLPPVSWENAFISLEGDWETYLKSRGRHIRKRLPPPERGVNSTAKLILRHHFAVAEIESVMAEIFDVERRSWKVAEGETMSSREGFRDFYMEAVRRYAQNGAWRAWILAFEGKPVASVFGFLDRGVLYAEKQSYDAAYAELSPGKVVLRALVEDSFHEKTVKEVDLDQKTPHLEAWATGNRRYGELTVYPRRAYSLFLFAMRRFAGPLAMRLKSMGRGTRKPPESSFSPAEETGP